MSTSSPSRGLKLHEEIDEKISNYSKFLQTVSESDRSSLQSRLLSAKLMKEKLVAVTALAKAQAILAEIDLLAAESNLKTAIDQLDTFAKDHNVEPPASARPSTDRPESTKSMTPKEPIIPASTETIMKNTQEDNKENEHTISRTIKDHKYASYNVESQKETSCSRTPDKSHKRLREKRKKSSSSKSKEKRSKLAHDSKTIEEKSTLLGTTLSPIHKSSTLVTKSVQTCRDWIDRQAKHTKAITNRIEDDENTVLIEDYSGYSSHRDAVNLSKALQIVMPPRTDRQDDLSRRPVSSKYQLLFEDDPPELTARFSKVNVKTEVQGSDPLNNSTEHLLNDLYKDIMQAKIMNVAKQASSSNIMTRTSPFCKVTLREMLEQC